MPQSMRWQRETSQEAKDQWIAYLEIAYNSKHFNF